MKIVFNFNSARHLWMAAALWAGCYREPDLPPQAVDPDADPPEVALGERLFRDGRFSQLFAGHETNAPLDSGEPVLQKTLTLGDPLPGPYAAGGMNCAACHLVDEQPRKRAYADFTRRSPIPDRGDGHHYTLRNTPSMVDAVLPRDGTTYLHFDGEFTSAAGLVAGTLTGRNFGWLKGEAATASAQVARVVREDDGSLAGDYGLVPYRDSLSGAAWLPDALRIPAPLRVDVAHAGDQQIFDGVCLLIAEYMKSLEFTRDQDGDFSGSPYDQFLRRNQLPLRPDPGEAPLDYARRLRAALDRLDDPKLVTDGQFQFHPHPFRFAEEELAGLRQFLAEGSCVSCHPPPDFTDFAFHNTGVSEEEYDRVHGAGAFAQLTIPDDKTDDRFAAIPSADQPGYADLGRWNQDPRPETIAQFKTPGLRDLGDSAPYMHDGSFDTLEEAIAHYRGLGGLRNGDPLLATLQVGDVSALAAFLRSLDEDYQ